MARILVYSMNYAPEVTGVGRFNADMVDWLARQGHEVRVVTAYPYYPDWAVMPGFRNGWFSRDDGEAARLWRCPLWVPRRPSGATRLLHLATFAASSAPVVLWQALVWRPAIVFVVEPSLLCAPAAWAAARLGGGRAWLHVQDLEVDAAFNLGLLRGSRVKRCVLALERWLLGRFDRISTISSAMRDSILGKGLSESRVVLFPNWADLDTVFPMPAASPLRRQLGIRDNDVVCLYSGNMGYKQGLEIIIDAARILAEERDIRFVLAGAGATRAELAKIAADLDNVQFIDLQPKETFNDLMNVADVHLLPQRADVEALVLPSKLLNMLASGRPVVAGATPASEIAQAVRHCGICVPPGDSTRFAAAIRTLRDDVEARVRLGRAARDYAQAKWGRNSVLECAFAHLPQ